MSAALRCALYVAAGIAIVAVAAAVLLGGLLALFWLCEFSTRTFDLPQNYSVFFLVGYSVVGFGGFVGGMLCHENRV